MGHKVHGMPLPAIEKMVRARRTPKHLKEYWLKKLEK